MNSLIKTYSAYRHKLGFYDLTGIIYELYNPNDFNKLDKLISKDLVYSDSNTCVFGFILNEDGSFKSDVSCYKFPDKQLILCTEDVADDLEKLDISYNIISNQNTIIQVEGYDSANFADQFYDYDIMALQFSHIVEISVPSINGPVFMARMGYTGEYGFQFILKTEDLHEFKENYLKKAHAESIVKDVVDYTSFEMLQPIDSIIHENSKYNLCDLNYGWNLDFLKDDFQGQEAVKELALRSTVSSIGFRTVTNNLSVGDKIYFDKEMIGEISALFHSLDVENAGFIGSAIVKKEYACSGINLATDTGYLETVSAPYTIPISWDDRLETNGDPHES